MRVGCVEIERMGLLQLKSYLNSFSSYKDENILKSWSDDDPKSDCCNWERVKCSDDIGGHTVGLSLYEIMFDSNFYQPHGFNLTLLHSFPQLKTLNFSYNWCDHLFDPIHGYKSFQKLEKLETLDLSRNNFNNSVLPFLSAARSLRILNLRSNSLEGVFHPNGLINFKELEVLDLSNNNINDFEAGDGLIKSKLKTLHLSGIRFSDTALLKGLEHLVELEVLSLAYNQFNHTRAYQVLKDMPKLQELDLTGNGFTDLDSLGKMMIKREKLACS
ncbi:unnamed protein product [Microthlaspi erraticum]|uniref:Leucine-rich repeat-containing N-terminal plant-type domain-containing protein n=1 Tax=Microthlaspi erraticum TaxID=1685480 RepID=A0A6D2ICI5_9BRAS|nr:unnamed protein product [Microthlaspi erraticum]